MHRTIRPIRPVAVILAAGLALGLTACSVNVVDETAPAGTPSGASSAPSSTPPAAPSGAASDEGSTTQSDTPKDAPKDSADEAGPSREELAAAATTVRCDGELVLDGDGEAIRVDGPCDHLLVTMNAGVVIADDIRALDVRGAGLVILTGTIAVLDVTGSGNTVRWTGATPKVTDGGAGNLLTAG
ncbi:hypothetical protein J2Y69_000383 [Microbacterium resistens]|uniref:DUF3060 domain-containing protein n=1 Tax=Microbacterium resistens TaxID=156977 RepID=A0ABU1S872_9MICO|nr:DUF3060 domain-containing protein [Microbacterium resistens]MDR6865801.1 hypothetical protein [Microbacterium resistens]